MGLRNWKLIFKRIDHWLDQSPAVRHLADDRLAKEVMSCLLHFAGERYDVLSLVVMPSHFHWVFRPRESWVASLTGDRSPRERIMQSVKGYAAKQCNQLLGRNGTFWQDESYDHWIRDYAELERIIHYVKGNPVRAGLTSKPEDFVYSSAYLRTLQGLEFGTPIRGGRPPGLPVT